ncbi:hypothetical protein P7K49_008849 [Saguinus oedipus]|uniref:Uncharacterized protein n=1 Tax=Saguinus oedipus TaxID=9490 RepID=A0ABQ9VYX7_SAGOE|nr:hypothetical protein P7K49_008849 [Saguinus oedipus]
MPAPPFVPAEGSPVPQAPQTLLWPLGTCWEWNPVEIHGSAGSDGGPGCCSCLTSDLLFPFCSLSYMSICVYWLRSPVPSVAFLVTMTCSGKEGRVSLVAWVSLTLASVESVSIGGMFDITTGLPGPFLLLCCRFVTTSSYLSVLSGPLSQAPVPSLAPGSMLLLFLCKDHLWGGP